MGSRVEVFAAIRRDARVEELSIRELASRHGVHRRTVRQALASAQPPTRKTPARSSPRLEPFKASIDAMLRADLDAPRKQRHTATRILARLVDEHAATGLSYSTVRDYVRVRRAEIDLEVGRRVEAFIAQDHAPGAEAEVDFGEVWVVLGGVRTKCFLFVFWLSHSGKAIHRVYPTQAQEAFLEGHIAAFEAFGGIPTGHIKYDNLKSAVSAVVHGPGRAREENDRWVLFRSHYGFDAFYCQPGIDGAHEKGGVEGEVGWFRRNHLVPMPEVDNLAELNARIEGWEAGDDGRRIGGRTAAGRPDFADRAAPAARRCRARGSTPALVLHPRVDRSAMITVRMVKYSVPGAPDRRRSGCCYAPRKWSCSTAAPWSPPSPVVTRGGTAGPRPLPRGAARQARCATRLDRTGPGPRGGHVHHDPRSVLGGVAPGQRRRRRHPRPDRRPAVAPPPTPST